MGSTAGSSRSPSGAEVVTVHVREARDLIKSGYTYLDVRTVEEFRDGHVEADKIYNIPYLFITSEGRVKNLQFLKEVSAAFSKDDLLVVGCKSGVRSLSAATDLLSDGFKNVTNMGGGYLSWQENGFSVKRPIPEDEL